MNVPIRLSDRLYVIDGFDLGVEKRTGIYVLMEDDITLVETGPSRSIPHIKDGLQQLGISLTQIKNIIVTHIHLDHAGGAGLLLADCPNAKVIVHPKGARHLADPSRLAAGAKAVYGDDFENLFEPIVPIPEDRILIKTEGDTLKISETCTLEFWDTPGHANHHIGIYDPVSNGLFAGDTAGIRYEKLIKKNVYFYPPSTSPNQFDPAKMRASIERMRDKKLDFLYFGHFSMNDKPDSVLHFVNRWLDLFMNEAEAAAAASETADQLSNRLLDQVRTYLRKQGIADDDDIYEIIQMDMQVSALGLLDYISKAAV